MCVLLLLLFCTFHARCLTLEFDYVISDRSNLMHIVRHLPDISVAADWAFKKSVIFYT